MNREYSDRPFLKVRDLSTDLDTAAGVTRVVDRVSFDLMKGEVLGIVGESGCGKTMTALSIMRLIPKPPLRSISGRVEIEGVNLLQLTEREMRKIRGSKISMVFQDALTALNPLMKVGDQISEVLTVHKGMSISEARREAISLLKMVGIAEPDLRIDQYPFELSGGMRQRVMIATSIAADPELLIADEPTTNLDTTIQVQILALLKEIQSTRRKSIIFITHNLGIVAWICDRVAVMYAGRIVEMGTTEMVLKNPMHPYTKALLRCVPRLDTPMASLEAIAGEVWDLMRDESCCRFHPRCEYAMEVCRNTEPTLIEVEEGHWVSCFLFSGSNVED